jgi:hypothetical protein
MAELRERDDVKEFERLLGRVSRFNGNSTNGKTSGCVDPGPAYGAGFNLRWPAISNWQ